MLPEQALPDGLIIRPALPSHWAPVGVWLTQTGFQDTARPSALVGQRYGFNLGVHVGDDLADVQQRRQALQRHVGGRIVWLNQVHGCEVVQAEAIEGTPSADAAFTTYSNTTLAIMTADCLPVVFVAFHEQTGKPLAVGAAHAGWKGLCAGVLQACLGKLRHGAGSSARVECFLGPAIGPQSFEVGPEVREAFVAQNAAMQACFTSNPTQANKWFADLYALARLVLAGAGVQAVHGGGWDTFTDPRWFSYRRGLQQQGQEAGRLATLVRLLSF
jgi:YfiH family protein